VRETEGPGEATGLLGEGQGCVTAPTTLTEIQSFLGLANFYQQFVLGFSHIGWALIHVTKDGGWVNLLQGKEQQ
jgi:hypothetical protein